MGLIFYIFGLMIAEGAVMGFEDETVSTEQWDRIRSHFGSVETSMLSLFMAVTGGDDWSQHFKTLKPLTWEIQSVYIFFILFTNVALMNVITGLFVDSAIKQAMPDRHALYVEKQRALDSKLRELEFIMRQVDL